MFIPFPAILFGWVIEGWGKVATYLVFAALTGAVGVGLWQLKEWSRLLALAMQAFGIVICGVYLVRPSLMLRYVTEIQQRMTPGQPQMPQQFQASMYSAIFGFSILLYIAIIAVLIYYRKAFERPTELSTGGPDAD
jgi:sulfite exporter TauE/SafE